MRHLTGHHVDLVGMGCGNDHIRVAGPGPLKNVRIGGMAHYATNIKCFGRAAHKL